MSANSTPLKHFHARASQQPPSYLTPLSDYNDAYKSKHPLFYHSVKWSPDGLYLLSHSEDQRIRLFQSPLPVNELGAPLPLPLKSPPPPSSVSATNEKHILSIRNGERIYDFCWNPYSSVQQPESFVFAVAAKSTPVKVISAYNGSTVGFYRTVDENEADIGAFSVALFHDKVALALSQASTGFRSDYNELSNATSTSDVGDDTLEDSTSVAPTAYSSPILPPGLRVACGYHEKIRIFDCNRPGSTAVVDIHTRSSSLFNLDTYFTTHLYRMRNLEGNISLLHSLNSRYKSSYSPSSQEEAYNNKTRVNYGPKRHAPGQRGTISTLCAPPPPEYSTSHQLLAAGSYSDEIGLYDITNGNLVALLRGTPIGQKRHPGSGRAITPTGVSQVKWAPDGSMLYVGYRKRDWIEGWDLRMLKKPVVEIRRPCGSNQKLFFDIDCSGSWLCSGLSQDAELDKDLEIDLEKETSDVDFGLCGNDNSDSSDSNEGSDDSDSGDRSGSSDSSDSSDSSGGDDSNDSDNSGQKTSSNHDDDHESEVKKKRKKYSAKQLALFSTRRQAYRKEKQSRVQSGLLFYNISLIYRKTTERLACIEAEAEKEKTGDEHEATPSSHDSYSQTSKLSTAMAMKIAKRTSYSELSETSRLSKLALRQLHHSMTIQFKPIKMSSAESCIFKNHPPIHQDVKHENDVVKSSSSLPLNNDTSVVQEDDQPVIINSVSFHPLFGKDFPYIATCSGQRVIGFGENSSETVENQYNTNDIRISQVSKAMV